MVIGRIVIDPRKDHAVEIMLSITEVGEIMITIEVIGPIIELGVDQEIMSIEEMTGLKMEKIAGEKVLDKNKGLEQEV